MIAFPAILAAALAAGTPPPSLVPTGATGNIYAFCQSGTSVPGTEEFVDASLGLLLEGALDADAFVTGPQGTSQSSVRVDLHVRPWAWRVEVECDYSALATPGGWCLARGDVGTTIQLSVPAPMSVEAAWSALASGNAGVSATLRKVGTFVNTVAASANASGAPVANGGSSTVALGAGAWQLFLFGSGQGITTGAPGTQTAGYAVQVDLTYGLPGDITGDGAVDGADLGALLGQWGACPAPMPGSGQASPCTADIDWNGTVDGADLGLLLAGWTG